MRFCAFIPTSATRYVGSKVHNIFQKAHWQVLNPRFNNISRIMRRFSTKECFKSKIMEVFLCRY